MIDVCSETAQQGARDNDLYCHVSCSRTITEDITTGSNTAWLTFSASGANKTLAESGARTLAFSSETAGSTRLELSGFVGGGKFWINKPSTALLNASARGYATASKPLIVGFVITDVKPLVLIRAAGPSLIPFGVTEAAADTTIEIHRSGFVPMENDDWWDSIEPGATVDELNSMFTYAGAFPFAAGSKDSAKIVRYPAGAYSVVVKTKANR